MPEATTPNTSLLEQKLSSAARFVTPASGDYAQCISRWAENAERKAAYVVQVADDKDVQAAILWAQDKSVPFAVCGGGHSTYGSSSIEGGLVIDLSKMNKVTVDPEQKLIRAQGGCIWSDVDAEAFKHGLATVGGTVGHTGIGGLTLGGGYGFLSCRYGLVVDNLVEATVCIADGRTLKANDTVNSDLFWAIRGGGGNFGVVTEFVYKAYSIPEKVWGGFMIYTPDKLEQILTVANGWLRTRSENETAVITYGRSPHHNFVPIIVVFAFYCGPATEAEQAYKDFIDLGPMANLAAPVDYPEINKVLYPLVTHGDRKLFKPGCFRDQLDVPTFMNAFKAYCEFSETIPDAFGSTVLIELFPTAALAKVPVAATAFANRTDDMLSVSFIPRWKSKDQDAAVAEWGNKWLADLLAGHVDTKKINGVDTNDCVYGNHAEVTTKSEKVFRENYPRLRQIKGKYDPKNLFNRWIPIEPMVQTA